MRAAVKSLIVIVVLAVAAGAAWKLHLFGGPIPNGKAAAGDPPGAGAMAMPVLAARVEVAPALDRVKVVGSLRADESVVMRSEIVGRIARLNFEEGQFVEAGAVLAELNPEEWLASIRQAEATARLQEVKMSRATELREKRVISQQEYDETRASLDEARAALELARARFAKAVIQAPFAGILGLRKVSPGDYVEAGQDIVNLEAINPLKVDFGIPERFAAQVGVGQQVEIGVDAYPNDLFVGAVYAVDPRIDPASRRVQLRARIDNPGGRLKPGMFAEVALVLDTREQAMWVPEQAIVPTTTAQFVYRVVDGKAVMTPVKLGLRKPGSVEILEGLQDSDVVVIEGQMKLFDGAPVMVGAPPPGQGPRS
ncbi:MAG: efflux RND transporter periplasmic adaptor subunit [Gammaproteobacteria bacterium]|nr:efflux RND transporter periplasmic adaptor subunit [Gammaproteobacteria bacterium]